MGSSLRKDIFVILVVSTLMLSFNNCEFVQFDSFEASEAVAARPEDLPAPGPIAEPPSSPDGDFDLLIKGTILPDSNNNIVTFSGFIIRCTRLNSVFESVSTPIASDGSFLLKLKRDSSGINIDPFSCFLSDSNVSMNVLLARDIVSYDLVFRLSDDRLIDRYFPSDLAKEVNLGTILVSQTDSIWAVNVEVPINQVSEVDGVGREVPSGEPILKVGIWNVESTCSGSCGLLPETTNIFQIREDLVIDGKTYPLIYQTEMALEGENIVQYSAIDVFRSCATDTALKAAVILVLPDSVDIRRKSIVDTPELFPLVDQSVVSLDNCTYILSKIVVSYLTDDGLSPDISFLFSEDYFIYSERVVPVVASVDDLTSYCKVNIRAKTKVSYVDEDNFSSDVIIDISLLSDSENSPFCATSPYIGETLLTMDFVHRTPDQL